MKVMMILDTTTTENVDQSSRHRQVQPAPCSTYLATYDPLQRLPDLTDETDHNNTVVNYHNYYSNF